MGEIIVDGNSNPSIAGWSGESLVFNKAIVQLALFMPVEKELRPAQQTMKYGKRYVMMNIPEKLAPHLLVKRKCNTTSIVVRPGRIMLRHDFGDQLILTTNDSEMKAIAATLELRVYAKVSTLDLLKVPRYANKLKSPTLVKVDLDKELEALRLAIPSRLYLPPPRLTDPLDTISKLKQALAAPTRTTMTQADLVKIVRDVDNLVAPPLSASTSTRTVTANNTTR